MVRGCPLSSEGWTAASSSRSARLAVTFASHVRSDGAWEIAASEGSARSNIALTKASRAPDRRSLAARVCGNVSWSFEEKFDFVLLWPDLCPKVTSGSVCRLGVWGKNKSAS